MDRGKFGKIMGESIGCGRSEEARLSHSSTKSLPEPARARNELLAPNQARTNGSTWKRAASVRLITHAYVFARNVVLTESLAETDTDGIEGFTEHLERHAGLDGNVPDTRTVEVHLDAALTRVLRNANYFVLWKYGPMERIL